MTSVARDVSETSCLYVHADASLLGMSVYMLCGLGIGINATIHTLSLIYTSIFL